MVSDTIAQLEHTSQLLLYNLRETHICIDKAWLELEIARSDLRDLMDLSDKLEEDIELKKKRLFL